MKPLTPTEKRVLDLVGQGMSSTQIAFALDISAHTVDTHRKNLLSKFAAKNSVEMVKKAIHSKAMSSGQDEVHNTETI